MTRSTITDKGQTTVPSEIRRALMLKPRQQIEWMTKRDGTAVIRPVRSISELAGCLRSDVSFPGIKEEKEIAAQAWVVDERVKE
jgi:AbrB family looped-hinge helix DNA binding protein